MVSYSGAQTSGVQEQGTSPGKAKVVDLTDENKSEDDLRRAIALSLQDGGAVNQSSAAASTAVSGISQEDQDVSKALEASLLESSQVRSKKEPQNPYDRQRDGAWPVGLKNVGQTCWFSAVIQSLFHIPAFRNLVLNYNLPAQTDFTSDKRKKILAFMAELRKLFSLLLKSQRKYVDPSKAVGILRGTLGGGNSNDNATSVSNQQDVSEFTHKLLDWLEEAFNIKPEGSKDCDMEAERKFEEPMDSETEKMDKEKESIVDNVTSSSSELSANQMNLLFYGKVEIEGRNNDVDFRRTEQFGQWPLQVNGYKDIHQSLEASMAYQSIDSGDTMCRSGQERWFTTLPPVLFLELSRFHFNTNKGIAEKINNQLEFPQNIFMDRYLELNKDLVRQKREEVGKLLSRRENLNRQLDCYMKYGGDSDKDQGAPLAGVLRSALMFARSANDGNDGEEEGGGQETMQVDSPAHSPAHLTPAQSLTNICDTGQQHGDTTTVVNIPIVREDGDTAMEVEATVEQTMLEPSQPKPKFVSELELKVLTSCLGRWIKEVDEEIAALTQQLKDIEAVVAVMYDEDILKSRHYRLHAVMVHEGDVNQGHYWAYVNHTEKNWLKFNDNTVSQSSWEEIIKEAAGGQRSSTSAYSCVYVDVSQAELFQDVSCPLLPTDLDMFVMEDNKTFAAEIVKYDEEQQRQKEAAEGGAAAAATQTVLIGDDEECQIIEQKPDLAQSHALLAKEATKEYYNLVNQERKRPETNTNSKNSASNVINKIYAAVKAKVHTARSSDGFEYSDIRLESFLHYLIANDLSTEHYKKALLEQVTLQEFEVSEGELGREVCRTAKESMKQIQASIDQDILHWHRAYHQYRIAVHYFVLGVEKYEDNKFEEALELLTVSYVVNEKILEDPPEAKVPSNKVDNKQVKNKVLKSRF